METVKTICPKCKNEDLIGQTVMLAKGHNENFIRILFWCQRCDSTYSEEWKLRDLAQIREFLSKR